MPLLNKKAIISGASKGLGAAIARSFVQSGASIAICARNKDLLLKKQRELKKIALNKAKVLAVPTDISSPKQVAHFVRQARLGLGSIDILIANAGTYGPIGLLESVDWKLWSKTIDTNLKGVVLQCRQVIPLFKKQGRGKIIIISGGGATKPMPNFTAYSASKAGLVRFSETLAIELQPYHIDVVAVSPGALNTDFLEQVLKAGRKKVGENFYQKSLAQKKSGGSSLELAAQLCVYLASEKTKGITGKLISAVWDPWQSLHQYYSRIAEKDTYTLRRIEPKRYKKQKENV